MHIKLNESGAPTYKGQTLRTETLEFFHHESDNALEDDYERNLACCIRAKRDGFILCLRPTNDRPASIGLSAHMAADALRSEDPARFVIVDRYDSEGNLIVSE